MSVLPPPPRRRIVFMLTPLVDVMFLLLIFFMLSSQTSPYSLVPIAAAGGDAGAPDVQPAVQPAAGAGEMLVSIARGYVRLNGARVEFRDLSEAIAARQAAGFSSAVVLTTGAATVQDVVSVLEAFKQRAFAELRLVAPAGAGQ